MVGQKVAHQKTHVKSQEPVNISLFGKKMSLQM